jgi:hypothetical protein
MEARDRSKNLYDFKNVQNQFVIPNSFATPILFKGKDIIYVVTNDYINAYDS